MNPLVHFPKAHEARARTIPDTRSSLHSNQSPFGVLALAGEHQPTESSHWALKQWLPKNKVDHLSLEVTKEINKQCHGRRCHLTLFYVLKKSSISARYLRSVHDLFMFHLFNIKNFCKNIYSNFIKLKQPGYLSKALTFPEYILYLSLCLGCLQQKP